MYLGDGLRLPTSRRKNRIRRLITPYRDYLYGSVTSLHT